MKKAPLFFLIIFLTSLPFVFISAYDAKTTHPILSEITINLYNQNSAQYLINNLEKQWIISGSIEEDQGIRCINHFYDPVFNETWEFGGIDYLFPSLTAKEWGQNPFAQAVYDPLYLALIGPIAKSPVYSKTNFTWQRAIYEYVKGNKEMAFKSLGHILHLIQDLSVPEHTRANVHIFFINSANSPYELYTAQSVKSFYTRTEEQVKNLSIREKKSLNEYFDTMAFYSNNYFYSPDTISNSKYKLPQPIYPEFPEIQDGKQVFYAMGKDENNNLFHLALMLKNNIGWRLVSGPTVFSLEDEQVLNDYWERLPQQAVLNGAGVINLFFKEVAKAKLDPQFVSKNESNFLLAAIGGITKFINGIFQKDSDFIILEDSSYNPSGNVSDDDYFVNLPTASQNTTTTKISTVSTTTTKPQTTTTTLKKTTTTTLKSTTTTKPSKEISFCDFVTFQSPSQDKVIINEVAWMGTESSANAEWIELKNISSKVVDISNWQLLDKDQQIKVVIESGSKIPAFGFYLLERTSDEAVPGITADYIYTGVLNNTEEGLRLFDDNCKLQDEVLANPDWPAGDNQEKRTMERKSDLTWQTSAVINGTPKKENSTGHIVSSEDNDPFPDNSSSTTTTKPTTTTTKPSLPVYPKILITEIKVAGLSSDGKTNVYDEFIELFNPNDEPIDLSGWYLQKKTKEAEDFSSLVPASLLEGKVIAPNNFFLIAHASSTYIQIADVLTSNYTITDNNTIVLKNPNREIVDKVGFGEANDCAGICVLHPEPGQSIQRKYVNNKFLDSDNNFNDFELQNCPNPRDFSSDNCLLPLTRDESPAPKIPYITEFSWHPFIEDSAKKVIEFRADSFPFIPSTEQTNNTFTAMAFYLHSDSDDLSDNFGIPWDYLGDKNNWELNNKAPGLILTYPTHVNDIQKVKSVIFTTDTSIDTFSSVPRKLAYDTDSLPEGNYFVIEITGTTKGQSLDFTPDQYVTIGYYGYANNPSSYLKLIAYDDTKFYFNPLRYFHPPTNIKNFEIECNNGTCDDLIFSWTPASDIDPKDILKYEIHYVFAKQGDGLDNNDLTRQTWQWSQSQRIIGEPVFNSQTNRFQLQVSIKDMSFINNKRLPGVPLYVFFGIKAKDSVGLLSEIPKITLFHIPSIDF